MGKGAGNCAERTTLFHISNSHDHAQEIANALPATTGEVIGPFSGKYRFLSNFFLAPVQYEGVTYPSTEHAFQAAKTLNPQERMQVAAIGSAGRCKRAGGKKGVILTDDEVIEPFSTEESFRVSLRDDWEDAKFDVMLEVVQTKFETHDNLRDLLLQTGDQPLVEINHWGDKIWGVDGGEGSNWLGTILMHVRAELSQ